MNTLTLPYPRSYWVVPHRLLAGFIPGSLNPSEETAKLSALLDCGVIHIVNLMEEQECDRSGDGFRDYRPALHALAAARGVNVKWTRHPIRDLNIPTVPEMVAILDTLDAAMGDGCTYVHCWGGRGRTGTVIGCWLTRHGDNGLARLNELTAERGEWCRDVPETPEQRAFVENWRVGQ